MYWILSGYLSRAHFHVKKFFGNNTFHLFLEKPCFSDFIGGTAQNTNRDRGRGKINQRESKTEDRTGLGIGGTGKP